MSKLTTESKLKYIENFVASHNASCDMQPYKNLRVDNGVLYSLDQPIAIKVREYTLVDSALHTLTTNLDIMEVKTQCIYRDLKFIELNFREASYLLKGVWDTEIFVEWTSLELECINSYIVEGDVYVLESDTDYKALVVGRTTLALSEFELFLGIADGAVAIDIVNTALDNVAYNNESSFFIGNLLLNKEEVSLPSDFSKTSGVTDICTVVKGEDEFYAVGRVNHKWYPKRIELDRYYRAEVLPIRFIK